MAKKMEIELGESKILFKEVFRIKIKI